MFHLATDVRYGLRKFLRAPLLISAAVITLALGIGANAAIFSLVDGIWMRPLAIADPGHLVAIQSLKAGATTDSERTDTASSFAEFDDIRAQTPAFADVAAVADRGLVLETNDGIQLLLARVVSDNYFAFMGVKPELGRLPSESEWKNSTTPLLVFSHGAWQRVLGGDKNIIGQTIRLKGAQAVAVAVMPAGFRGTDRMMDPQVYVAQSSWLALHPGERNRPRGDREYNVYARLRPGVTLVQARGQLQAASANLAAAYPQTNQGRTFSADWNSNVSDTFMRTVSLLLLGIAGAVLLIACTNVANLLMALNDSRRREIAMRVALGATRGQLLRQLVTEYALLALAGLGGALLIARQVIAIVPALLPTMGFPLGFDFRIDDRVIFFSAVVALVALLAFGLTPALSSTRLDPLAALRAQMAPQGRFRIPARKIFVVAQIAISMGLLIATGLLIKALIHVQTMDMGFNSAQNAVLLDIAVPEDSPRYHQMLDEIATRARALPGVTNASVARVVPFPDNGGGATQVVLKPGEVASPTAGTSVWYNLIDNEYFRTMQVPLLRGRNFGSEDGAKTTRVAILNQTLAKQLFGTEDVVGKHFRLGRRQPVDVEVVGLAKNGVYGDLNEAPQPFLYLPSIQYEWTDMMLIATTSGDANALLPAARKMIRDVSQDIIVLEPQTMTDHMQVATYSNRMAAWLTTSLGGLALLLTGIGLYGVTAYAVSRRTREIGIRMALGAMRGSVFASVVRDGLVLTAVGAAIGVGLALLLGRGLSSFAFGVKPMDPEILAVAAAIVAATSLAALVSPARRALKVDPVRALRDE
ncbi:ADOP family duplicated permease [Occallatibacter riparius]|uniref:ADOP family duplicated permease n=1 Tax=Occallatibacter riparius TaxID=1002689 RepID=A0A9J7BNX1_9BACT|nr:ADOP family duplicated permease [Occallatibacter riparius]UWZ82614.1 ADOP family duplicated permease [Occallatibacter riparius]